jgi:hypothetical protein
MTIMSWFSSKIRLVCLIEPKGAVRYQDSVLIFTAKDFEDALRRAVTLGKSKEEEYRNIEGQRVVWQLKEVISLDKIPGESLDGAEVYSEPIDLASGEIIPFDTEFHPELSKPTQTI